MIRLLLSGVVALGQDHHSDGYACTSM